MFIVKTPFKQTYIGQSFVLAVLSLMTPVFPGNRRPTAQLTLVLNKIRQVFCLILVKSLTGIP